MIDNNIAKILLIKRKHDRHCNHHHTINFENIHPTIKDSIAVKHIPESSAPMRRRRTLCPYSIDSAIIVRFEKST